MKTALVPLAIVALCLSSLASFAQQPDQSSKPITGYSHGDPRYPVDSTTNWAIGAKRELPNELKTQLDAGGKVLIIDVRRPADYAKETLPGAINIPLVELEGRLRQMPRDTYLVFT